MLPCYTRLPGFAGVIAAVPRGSRRVSRAGTSGKCSICKPGFRRRVSSAGTRVSPPSGCTEPVPASVFRARGDKKECMAGGGETAGDCADKRPAGGCFDHPRNPGVRPCSGRRSPNGPRVSETRQELLRQRVKGADQSPNGPRVSETRHELLWQQAKGADQSPNGPRVSETRHELLWQRAKGADPNRGTGRSERWKTKVVWQGKRR